MAAPWQQADQGSSGQPAHASRTPAFRPISETPAYQDAFPSLTSFSFRFLNVAYDRAHVCRGAGGEGK
jgi:hypothetical protein